MSDAGSKKDTNDGIVMLFSGDTGPFIGQDWFEITVPNISNQEPDRLVQAGFRLKRSLAWKNIILFENRV